MFFAYMVLRQSVGPLEPAVQLALWHRVFRRFFPWVWASIVLLLLSGYSMLFLYFGGFAGAGLHIYIMQGTGIVMMLLFLHLFFAPWPVRSGRPLRSAGQRRQIGFDGVDDGPQRPALAA